MDGKLGTFLLGVIAAVVLVMLWKKERGSDGMGLPTWMATAPGASSGSDCPGSCASPAAQAGFDSSGTSGFVTPGTPPLGSATALGSSGATSFYSQAGGTADTSFTFGASAKTPGSPTVPAATVPTRATARVPGFQGFHQQYNVAGVPVALLHKTGYIQ